MANYKLTKAKNEKNDEFYTQFADIAREIEAYLEYNPDTFRDKVVLLPCDDPEWSNFTLYFAQNFDRLGLRKLISTSYAYESKRLQFPYQPTLFESESDMFELSKSATKGKIFTLSHDISGDGKIDHKDLQWQYLEGDGDFRSAECIEFLKEADVVVTNPPFSLFREYVAQLMEYGKKFLIIGNMNAVTYKEIFPYIMNNEMWLGHNAKGGTRKGNSLSFTTFNGDIKDVSAWWYTNIDHGRRHQPLQLMTMEENLKYSKHKEIRENGYPKYDNYDAIEVAYTDAIPSDYDEVMGVPISFLEKYCPEQFEIIGITKTWFGIASKLYGEQIQIDKQGVESKCSKLNDGASIEVATIPNGKTYYTVDDKIYIQTYARILIRKIKKNR